MTIMEHKPNANLVHETNKFHMINLNNHQETLINHPIKQETLNYSRKNSATGSSGIPASNLSLSSTSSGGSSIKYNESNKFKKFSNSSLKKYDSTPQTSRRASGNSITIRITNEKNDNIEDESLNKVLNELDSFDKHDVDDLVVDRGYGDKDRDEAEDTTSNSTSNEFISSIIKQNSKKKLKDRRKLIRSAAQQQHHLTYQESEDQIEEELKSRYNSVEQLNENSQYKSQNSAFDELFAAAETGNTSMSAIVEAKMAASAENDNEFQFIKKNTSIRSRNNSFRVNSSNLNSNKKVQSIDESKFEQNTDSTNTINKSNSSNKKNSNNALNVETNLGAPQQLTRSCSCKRPGSFKKMKAKSGISPNRTHQMNGSITNSSQKINSSGPITNANASRRGTQCSITIQETLDKQGNRAGSLPFENNQNLLGANEDEEVCRVRQFNITTKGSVINRGDSFKRSFKRSNNSLSSKKEIGTTHYEGNTLNLPEYQDYNNKSSNSSNCGDLTLNEPVNENAAIHVSFNEVDTNNMALVSNQEKKRVEPPKNFLVYLIGSTGVGKNALIKQFQTSEYRGTYDIDQQNGKILKF